MASSIVGDRDKELQECNDGRRCQGSRRNDADNPQAIIGFLDSQHALLQQYGHVQ